MLKYTIHLNIEPVPVVVSGVTVQVADGVLTVVTPAATGTNFAPVVFAVPVVNIDYVESEEE